MSQTPSITDAEWEVMNVLWDSAPATAVDVAERVCGKMNWHPKTVKTLLGRLVKKGVLRYRVEGNAYVYSPAIPRQKFVRKESATFLERVFGGETTPMLGHFVRNAHLSKKDIEELQKILDEKKEGGR